MKAVMSTVPPDILAWRRTTGADCWDEVWEGVLHMGPSPNLEHQRFEWALETYLNLRWAEPRGARVYHDVNVSPGGDWRKNYRIPDLIILTSPSRAVERDEYVEGPPDVVVEIRSPDDESLEKLAFYAALGVREVWVFDRDTKAPSLYVLEGEAYRMEASGPDGWYSSDATEVEFRVKTSGKLTIRLRGDASTEEEIPR